ncbi:MAG: FkbM family methyltransferase [Sphingomicrobium sp.]|nr:FkbM family methyltransferase [Sphingomonadales bacterium]
MGRAIGADIIPCARTAGWIEEAYLKSLLDALRADCVFDVGANIGQFGQILRGSGFSGTILSFEPAPRAFARLSEVSRDDHGWHVFNIALGATDQMLPFNVMKEDVFSSFRMPTAKENAAFCADNQIEATLEVPVRPVASLIDELAERYRFTRPFLKMDTQGFDLEVIRGAGTSLQRFIGLSSEIAMRRLYEGSPHMAESIEFINTCGFDFVNFLPVHPGRILNPLEFNSFAVRRDLVDAEDYSAA